MTGSDGVRRKGAQAKPEGAESCQSSTEPGGILRLFGMLGQEPLGPSCLTPNLHNDRQKQESQDGKEDRLPDAGRREKTSELTQQQADRHEEREAALVGHPTGKMPEQGQMSRCGGSLPSTWRRRPRRCDRLPARLRPNSFGHSGAFLGVRRAERPY